MNPLSEGRTGMSAPDVGSTTAAPDARLARVVEMSDQAAMTEEPNMRKKETKVRPVTRPPNQMTSPYA